MLKRTVFIVVIILLGGTGIAKAQRVDSCLTLYQNVWGDLGGQDSLLYNPDSVMLDTCDGPPNYSYPNMYAKRYWLVVFQYHIINLDSVSSDSILVVPWTAIDTTYPSIRAIFDSINESFGGVRIIKKYPQIADTGISTSNEFLITVGNYSPVDTILSMLNGSPLIRAYFNSRPFVLSAVNISLAPTPFEVEYTDPWHVSIRGLNNSCSYMLYDNLGRLVSSGEIAHGDSIDLSQFEAGLYFIRILGAVNQVFKILIQK